MACKVPACSLPGTGIAAGQVPAGPVIAKTFFLVKTIQAIRVPSLRDHDERRV
jgi:hypothetical protein